MKKIYKKPGMEVIDLRIQGHLLEASAGHDDNKTGQQGGNASDGGSTMTGDGTRSPEFFGGDIIEED